MSVDLDFKNLELDKICRVCLTEKKDMRPLFREMMVDMLNDCAQIHVEEIDGWPDKICMQCVQQINRFHSFKKKVERLDQELKAYIKGLTVIVEEQVPSEYHLPKINIPSQQLTGGPFLTATTAANVPTLHNTHHQVINGQLVAAAPFQIQSNGQIVHHHHPHQGPQIIPMPLSQLLRIQRAPHAINENNCEIIVEQPDSPSNMVEQTSQQYFEEHLLAVTEDEEDAIEEIVEEEEEVDGDDEPQDDEMEQECDLEVELKQNELIVDDAIGNPFIEEVDVEDMDGQVEQMDEIVEEDEEQYEQEVILDESGDIEDHGQEEVEEIEEDDDDEEEEEEDREEEEEEDREEEEEQSEETVSEMTVTRCTNHVPIPLSLSSDFDDDEDREFMAEFISLQTSCPAPGRHICNLCHKEFKYSKWLHTHMKQHSNWIKANCKKQPQCEICHKSFKGPGMLKMHMKTHEVKTLHCSLCQKGFTNEYHLRLHMNKHKMRDDNTFKCEPCNHVFISANDLKLHKRQHHKGVRMDLMCKTPKSKLDQQNFDLRRVKHTD